MQIIAGYFKSMNLIEEAKEGNQPYLQTDLDISDRAYDYVVRMNFEVANRCLLINKNGVQLVGLHSILLLIVTYWTYLTSSNM